MRKKGSKSRSTASRRHPFKVGDAWFIRTVTFHFVGRVAEITELGLVLEESSHVGWPAARFKEVVMDGKINDTEPLPDGTFVAFGAITDAEPWGHSLSRVQL